VDDAIVVIENVQRHISEGLSDAHKAASVAMGEVAGRRKSLHRWYLSPSSSRWPSFPGHHGYPLSAVRIDDCFLSCNLAFNALTLTPLRSPRCFRQSASDREILYRSEQSHRRSNERLQPLTPHGPEAQDRSACDLHLCTSVHLLVLSTGAKGFIPEEDQATSSHKCWLRRRVP